MDYCKALRLSFLFYEAQRSGKLPANNRIPWRGDSFLDDVVPGGYFDAGDHLKLLFPLCTSLALIGLAGVEFPDAFEAAKQTQHLRNCLEWGAEFIMKCRVGSTKFIGQIGDPGKDHAYWGRPEEAPQSASDRPALTWDAEKQGASDLLAAASSALTTASLVFKHKGSYSKTLLKHARELYVLASTKKMAKYNEAYPGPTAVYVSSGYWDDLALAAVLLWKATTEKSYLADAKTYLDKVGRNSWVSWDSVGVLVSIVLKAGGEARRSEQEHLDRFLKDWKDGFQKTPKGLVLAGLGGWGNLRYSTSAAFGLLLAAKYETDKDKKATLIRVAKGQVDYALGSSGQSFVVGFGSKFPQQPHHRAASCDPPKHKDWGNAYHNPGPNPHVLYGALVGGPPGPSDEYKDDRTNYQTTEVAVDYNAGYTGALAALIHFEKK